MMDVHVSHDRNWVNPSSYSWEWLMRVGDDFYRWQNKKSVPVRFGPFRAHPCEMSSVRDRHIIFTLDHLKNWKICWTFRHLLFVLFYRKCFLFIFFVLVYTSWHNSLNHTSFVNRFKKIWLRNEIINFTFIITYTVSRQKFIYLLDSYIFFLFSRQNIHLILSRISHLFSTKCLLETNKTNYNSTVTLCLLVIFEYSDSKSYLIGILIEFSTFDSKIYCHLYTTREI